MKILLFGPAGVGKSTIIREVVRRCGMIPGGFLTVWDDSGVSGERRLHLQPAACGDSAFLPQNRVAVCRADGSWEAYPQVFDAEGVRLLTFARKPRLIVMDELGFMEKDAARFQQRVMEILGGPCPVLGVTKPCATTPFLRAVRAHPRVTAMEITPQNREENLAELTRLFQSSAAYCR